MKISRSLIGGSIILLVSINLFNLFNFLFQFSMARLLTIAEYGVLATLFSIIYIFSLFMESMQAVITKYSSKESEDGKLKNIFKKTISKSVKVSVYLFVLYLVACIPLSFLLKIDYTLLALTGLTVFIVFSLPISRGILQGKKRFTPLGINMIIEAILKLAIGIFLVYLGWKVYGAIIGTLIGAGIAFLLSLGHIKGVLLSKEKKAITPDIRGYSQKTFIIIFTIMVFFSLDVVMAKILFSDDIAGAYALASVLAKIIFFGTLPISKAMFPLTAEGKKAEGISGNIFLNALVLLILGIAISLAIFYFFPGLLILIFSGKAVEASSQILFYVGIAIGLISLTNLNLLYKLSLDKTDGYLYLPAFILVEIALLVFFSNNLLQFSLAFIVSSAAFLWGSIVLLND